MIQIELDLLGLKISVWVDWKLGSYSFGLSRIENLTQIHSELIINQFASNDIEKLFLERLELLLNKFRMGMEWEETVWNKLLSEI